MFGKYKGKPFTLNPNKTMIPINSITFDRVGEWNDLYLHCLNNFKEVKPTPSGSMPCDAKSRLHQRFMVITGHQRFELVVVCGEGCYRFVLENELPEDNSISGASAVRIFYKKASQFKIDLKPYLTSSKEGWDIKQTIKKPHIQIMLDMAVNRVFKHVYHLDFKSSYASRVIERYPELKPIYEELFSRRHENDGFFKHVLTNSIGCFQSKYCPNYYKPHKTVPFMLSKLAKAAVDGTREIVEEYLDKLKSKGFVPLLTNTDGIWFFSPDNQVYHDEREGEGLGCWEMDHMDCDFLMLGPGCYQYVEDGQCETVLRGKSAYDSIEPNREKWPFGIIRELKGIISYKFEKGKGVLKA